MTTRRTATTTSGPKTPEELFDREAYEQFRQKRLEAKAYTSIEPLLKEAGRLDGNEHGIIFTNDTDDDYGHWDLERFEQHEDVNDVLHDANAAVQAYLRTGAVNLKQAYYDSTDNITATVEWIVDSYHPSIRVDGGFFTSDTDRDMSRGVLLTPDGLRGLSALAARPLTIRQMSDDEYNPFKGYPQVGTPTPRHLQHDIAKRGLLSFADPGISPQAIRHRYRINKTWLRRAYGNAALVKRSIDNLQVAVFAQTQTRTDVEIAKDGTISFRD